MASLRSTLLKHYIQLLGFRRNSQKLYEQAARNPKASSVPSYFRKTSLQETTTVAGRVVHTLTPKGFNQGPHVLYLHGGAYAMEMTGYHWRFLQQLMKDRFCRISYFDYPLIPEHNYKDAIAYGIAAIDHITTKFGKDTLVIAGDSAGAGLATALTQNLVARDRYQPFDKVLLISPWICPANEPARKTKPLRVDPMLNPAALEWAATQYAGDLLLNHPNVSPLYGSFKEFPDVGIWCGTNDIFYEDMALLEDKLTEEGISFKSVTATDQIHCYPLLPTPEAKQSIQEMRAFIKR